MARGGCLLSAFLTFSRDSSHYRNVKNSRDSQTSTACAGRAYKHVIFGTGICIALIVGAMLLIQQKDNALFQIVGFILLVVGGLGAVSSTLHGIVNSFYQIALPKKSAGWISLLVTILMFGGAIAAVIITLGAVG